MILKTTYKVQLDADEDTIKYLRTCCDAYKSMFNAALDVQYERMSYATRKEDQIINSQELVELMLNQAKGFKKYDRIEKGIIERAVKGSNAYFLKWWKRHVNGSKCIKDFSYMRENMEFYTCSVLKVSKGGFVYFPKFKRVKLKKSSTTVPVGSYERVRVFRECGKWYIKFRTVEGIHEECHLSGELKIHINSQGDITVGETQYPCIVRSGRYQEAFRKYRLHLDRIKNKAKAQQESAKKNGEEVKVKLTKQMIKEKYLTEKAIVRMKNLVIAYAKDIARDVRKREPVVVMLTCDLNLDKNLFEKLKISDCLKLTERIIRTMGAKMRFSDHMKKLLSKK